MKIILQCPICLEEFITLYETKDIREFEEHYKKHSVKDRKMIEKLYKGGVIVTQEVDKHEHP